MLKSVLPIWNTKMHIKTIDDGMIQKLPLIAFLIIDIIAHKMRVPRRCARRREPSAPDFGPTLKRRIDLNDLKINGKKRS